jgi:hypothetical protein
MRALVLVVAAAGLATSAAFAKTPLPQHAQGAGKEPTAGGGVIGSAPFAARSALVQYDKTSGDVYIYVFKKPTTCHVVSFSDTPYVWVWIHTEGTPLDVGRAMRTSGTSRFVQVNFVLAGHYVAVQPGVRLTLSRVDTAKGGVWHGHLTVAKTRQSGKTFSYDGTFAARWCGTA